MAADDIIPNKFAELKKARAKLQRADDSFREAHQNMHDNRGIWAGKVREAQITLNQIVDELIDLVTRYEAGEDLEEEPVTEETVDDF